jgi:N-ethylmaleimide reductase
MIPNLFSPIKLGACALKNRIFMPPLTRSRAGKGNAPQALNSLYYAQRASAGLIIAEATQVSPEAQGYISTPGSAVPDFVTPFISQCVPTLNRMDDDPSKTSDQV